nr:hypothetical protein [Bacillus thuringiensis]
MNCTPNHEHLKKPHYNGINDRNEVRRMSKIIFNEDSNETARKQ